MHLISYWQIL